MQQQVEQIDAQIQDAKQLCEERKEDVVTVVSRRVPPARIAKALYLPRTCAMCPMVARVILGCIPIGFNQSVNQVIN